MHLSESNNQGLWRARQRMIEDQLRARQISDERVLAALGKIPRELFVREALRDRAYEDSPLPIGASQTISQPFMVALMTELLQLTGSEKVLEIGTGSGYQAAVLAELAEKVFTIERHRELTRRARQILEELGYTNVLTHIGDGTIGWTEFAPYDRIIVTAGAPSVPESLLKQLKEGGLLVAPVGDKVHQKLLVLTKSESGIEERDNGGCVFVPLIGREGWSNG